MAETRPVDVGPTDLEIDDGKPPYRKEDPDQSRITHHTADQGGGIRHARDLGVTSDRIPTHEAWFEAASVVLHTRPDGTEMAREMDEPGPGQRVAYYVARDADQTPLAFARVAVFDQFAVLFTILSHLDRQPSASWARYQLHTFLSLDLGCSGVTYLVVGSALREPVGNQYLQHLLGYRACNLASR